MRILFSKSGSGGNCSVIQSDNGHFIIIDAGLKYKTVDKAIGYKLHNADALFITHAHKDHTEHLREFVSSGIKTFIGGKTQYNVGQMGYYSMKELFVGNRVETDGFLVLSFPLYHTNSDGTECECFGFLIVDKDNGEKMLWATDTQFIKNRFAPLEYYCIESNYFERDSYEGEADYVEKSVEMRRVHSHMSFETAVKFLQMQDLSKCKEIHLLHVSHSAGDMVKQEMKEKLENIIDRRTTVYV